MTNEPYAKKHPSTHTYANKDPNQMKKGDCPEK